MRAGLRLTSSITIDDPGTMVAATTKKAADDGSPGTASSNADRHAGAHPNGPVVDPLDGRTQRVQHPLGVIPARRRLDDFGLAARLQPREHERGLHLAARHRELVADALERAAAHRQRREVAVGAPVERRAHGPQRRDDPAHRSLRE